MRHRLVAMLLKIGHERCPAGTDVFWIVWAVLALLMDIASSVFQMRRAELPDPAHTGVVSVTQRRLIVPMRDHILTNGRSLFDSFDKRPVGRRHIITHFHEIRTQGVVLVRN